MSYVEKTSSFEVAPPCHSMLTNTLIHYLKNKFDPYLFCSGLKILCLRNVQNFIDVPKGFLILKRQYTIFDNPLYLCKSSFTMYNIKEIYDVYFYYLCIKCKGTVLK